MSIAQLALDLFNSNCWFTLRYYQDLCAKAEKYVLYTVLYPTEKRGSMFAQLK